jgi:2,4-dienoyl-CoA reductase-like NADH-dependent reductase (Old Yellow Enzyme family)
LELVEAISQVLGGTELICVKIGPTDTLNDSVVTFDEMQETYTYLIRELVKRKLGIVNICRRGANIGTQSAKSFSDFVRPEGYSLPQNYDPVLDFGRLVKGPGNASMLMANQDYDIEEANQLVKESKIDLIMIGRPFIFNPVRHDFKEK